MESAQARSFYHQHIRVRNMNATSADGPSVEDCKFDHVNEKSEHNTELSLSVKVPGTFSDFDFHRYFRIWIPTHLKFEVQNVKAQQGCTFLNLLFSSKDCTEKAKASLDRYIRDNASRIEVSLSPLSSGKSFEQRTRDEFLEKGAESILKRSAGQLASLADQIQDARQQYSELCGQLKRLRKPEEHAEITQHKTEAADKLRELESLDFEFNLYNDSVKQKLDEMRKSTQYRSCFLQLNNDFDVEVNRLKAALPMYIHRSKIVSAIENNQVCLLIGEPGSGKSTQLIQYLRQIGYTNSGIVVCTQPRKIAALTLAKRVASELETDIGNLVGYQVGQQSEKKAKTKLLFVTDHFLLNDCLRDKTLSSYSCIILDEAHERAINTDLLLGMIKKLLPSRPDLRLVISSATINPELFKRFFDNKCEVLHIPGRKFPVDVIWSSDDYDQCSVDKYEIEAVRKTKEIHLKSPPGDILIFLATPIEAEKCCRTLEQELLNTGDDFVCMALHGKLAADEQQNIFEPQENKRKIVFATNCAETSVTIPGIRYVVDTGYVKELKFDPIKRMSSLVVTMINKSSAEQRKGRAGRIADGVCYRLYGHESYAAMDDEPKPEILRVHVEQALLNLMQLGVDPLEFDFVDAPPIDVMTASMENLTDIGAVSCGAITELGEHIARLGLEPKLSLLVLQGIDNEVAMEMLVVAASSTISGGIFYRGNDDQSKKKCDLCKVKFSHEAGDTATLLHLYQEWSQATDKKQFCLDNSLNQKSLSMIERTTKDLRLVIKKDLKMDVSPHFAPDFEGTIKLLKKLLLKCFFGNLCYSTGNVKSGYVSCSISQQFYIHPSSSFMLTKVHPEWVIYQNVLKTSRPFLINVTSVDHQLVTDLVKSGRVSPTFIEKSHTMSLIVCKYFGSILFKAMVGPRFMNLRKFEAELQKQLPDCMAIIDANAKRGKIEIMGNFCPKEVVEKIIEETICDQRESLKDDAAFFSLSKESESVQAYIGRGAAVSTLVISSGCSKVKITTSPSSSSVTKQRMLELFSQRGKVLQCVKYESKKINSNVWGHVIFEEEESAKDAIRNSNEDICVEIDRRVVRKHNDMPTKVMEIKVEWVRRRCKDFGFMNFENAFNCLKVAALRQFSYRGKSIKIKPHVKTPNSSLHIRGLPENTDAIQFKDLLLMTAGIDDDTVKFTVAREKVEINPAIVDSLTRQLSGQVSEVCNKENFSVSVLTPRENSNEYVAFINCYDLDAGEDVFRLLSIETMNGSPLAVKRKIKDSIFVSKLIFSVVANEITEAINNLKQKFGDKVSNVTVTTRQRKSGHWSIEMVSVEAEVMTDVKDYFSAITQGFTLDSNNVTNYEAILTTRGKTFVSQLGIPNKRIVKFDSHSDNIHVYGSSNQIKECCTAIKAFIQETLLDKRVEIDLRGPGMPRGAMKELIIKYGIVLENLKTEGASVELNHRCQTVTIHGQMEDSVQNIKALVNNFLNSITPRCGKTSEADEEDEIECNACLCSIEDGDMYRLEICGHAYCKGCLQRQLHINVTSAELPMKCCVEDCCEDWALKDIYRMLSDDVTMETVVKQAVKCFVMSNNTDYRYCPTPDCPLAYRVTSGECKFECDVCGMATCRACHAQYHSGISCEGTKSTKTVDMSILEWLQSSKYDAKKCPNCETYIEKVGGCQSMACSGCKKHICWKCLTFFDDSQDCYRHLQKAHGGYV